jgi:hypothetical protein
VRTRLAYTFAAMTRAALKDVATLTPEQLSDLGTVSRAMFEAAWGAEAHDHALMRYAISAVVRTYATDAEASEQLLRRLLTNERLTQFGYEEIPDLAHELEALFGVAPEFCAEVYEVAFTFEETSDEKTVLTAGVLGLTSTQKQDWNGGRYALGEDYPAFLAQSPAAAIDALIAVRNAYIQRHGWASLVDATPQSIKYSDQNTAFLRDAGRRDFVMAHEDETKVLTAFESWLKELAQADPSEAARLVGLVLEKTAPVSIWRTMLRAGAEYPDALVAVLGPVATVPEAVTSWELSPELGRFLGAVYHLLDEDDRRRVEDTVVAMDTSGATGELRSRLVASLPDEGLVTDAARELHRTIDVDAALAKPDDDFGFESRPYDERTFLRENGVDVDSVESKRVDAALARVKEFAEQHLNTVPSVDDAHCIAPALTELKAVLDETDAHPVQQASATGYLAQAARLIARQSELGRDDEMRLLVVEILLAASKDPEPTPRENDAPKFDNSESWSSPAPRVDATDGLMRLASRSDSNDEGMTDAIRRLSQDHSAVVRLHVAQAACILANAEPDLAWKLLDDLATDESLAVRKAVISALSYMCGLDRQHVVRVTTSIFDNAGDREKSVAVRICGLRLLTKIYIWFGDEDADATITASIERLPEDTEVTRTILMPLRDTMTSGEVDGSEPDLEAARTRAVALAERVVVAAINSQEEIAAQQPAPMGEWDKDAIARWRDVAGLIDTITMEYFFAAGAHRDNQRAEEEHFPSPAQERFYWETASISDRLTSIGHPHAAHRLLETLEFFIDVDPRGVFLRIAATIRAGQQFNYQYDNLAEGLFVRLVERYLAEHRTLLQQDPKCSQALVEMLDIFVRAGWLSAHRLTYGLDEIYR